MLEMPQLWVRPCPRAKWDMAVSTGAASGQGWSLQSRWLGRRGPTGDTSYPDAVVPPAPRSARSYTPGWGWGFPAPCSQRWGRGGGVQSRVLT